MTFCVRSRADQADYKTDYIAVGCCWTTLDNALQTAVDSRAIWTSLDESGQRAECSKTAGLSYWTDVSLAPSLPPRPTTHSGRQRHRAYNWGQNHSEQRPLPTPDGHL